MSGITTQISSKKFAKVLENFCGATAEMERFHAHP